MEVLLPLLIGFAFGTLAVWRRWPKGRSVATSYLLSWTLLIAWAVLEQVLNIPPHRGVGPAILFAAFVGTWVSLPAPVGCWLAYRFMMRET